jgi:hypothetical protein
MVRLRSPSQTHRGSRVVRATFCEPLPGAVLQILMEADVEGLIGAGPHERSPDRRNYRNGSGPNCA